MESGAGTGEEGGGEEREVEGGMEESDVEGGKVDGDICFWEVGWKKMKR